MKLGLNKKDENYGHYLSFYGPEIDTDTLDVLKCENCQKVMGKYSVSDDYGHIAICNDCLKQQVTELKQ